MRLFSLFPLAVLAAACASPVAAPDAAREERWAREIVPQVVVGDAVWLATPQRANVLALYSEPAQPAKGGIVLVHGLGVHPDWGLNGALRVALADRGFATLSVQMPVLAADALRESYSTLFPVAGERLSAAVAFLQSKGHSRIAVVSHSLGAAMANTYLATAKGRAVAAWIPVGMLVDFASVPKMPVLDVVAEHDFAEALTSVRARARQRPRDRCSGEVRIAATDHYFANATGALVDAIVPFVERAFRDDC